MTERILLHEFLVVRRVGDLRLVVNIRTNTVYEVDELCCFYIEEAQRNSGVLDLERLGPVTRKSREDLAGDIATLNEALQE